MASNLDKSLDEIIASTPRRSTGGRRGGRQPNRSSPYARRDGGVQKRGQRNDKQQQQQQQAAAAMAQSMMVNPAAFVASQQQSTSNGKIMISNLDYGVTEADLRELFSQVGPVRRASLNFGANGKSKGTGEVQFRNAAHAALAVERFHGVTLDGRAMKIELAFNPMAVPMMMPAMMPGPVVQAPGSAAAAASANGKKGAKKSTRDSNASSSRRGGRRGGRRSGADKDPSITKESLDADLDSYMQEAEQPATSSAN